MIAQLKLNNFMGFNELSVDFSPGINVIIGENGTGKTHLLKAAYGLCSSGKFFKDKTDAAKDDLEAAITKKMLRLFMPLDDKLGKMHHVGAEETAKLDAHLLHKNTIDNRVITTFFNNSKSLAIHGNTHCEEYLEEPVFIPTKEVLSFMKGFNSLYERYELSFDQTYQDVCLLLDLPAVRAEILHPKSKWAMAEIEKICKGRFVFYGGGKVTFKTENTEYSANAMAEGFRKAGMLSRLLETGVIQPGVSGPLFWDEPETNMNPKLMEILVQILLELARDGQQIILATHDYVLLKWFNLRMNKAKDDHVRFHVLYRDVQSSEIKIASTDDYLEIERNPITEAFNNLTIAHAKLRLEGEPK
jgi:predicted ATPase